MLYHIPVTIKGYTHTQKVIVQGTVLLYWHSKIKSAAPPAVDLCPQFSTMTLNNLVRYVKAYPKALEMNRPLLLAIISFKYFPQIFPANTYPAILY